MYKTILTKGISAAALMLTLGSATAYAAVNSTTNATVKIANTAVNTTANATVNTYTNTVAKTTTNMTTTAMANNAIDFQQHGFSTVVAKANIPAGQSATLTADGATITIPAGTFNVPVKFELLEGALSQFSSKAPSGQVPLYDFAFKVMNQNNHKLIVNFQKPVIFSYTNPNVNQSSKYYDINAQGSYMLNPIPAKISGTTLKHGIKGAPVGWVVTAPSKPVAATTSPITGLPFENWFYIGAGLIVIGGAILAFRRKLS